MKLRYFLFALLPAIVAGCSLTQPLPRDLPEQVQAWVADREYGKALDMLDRVRSDHPRYIELIRMKPQVEAKAKAFARRISREAQAAWRADEWRRAHERLGYGLEHFAQSERLQATRDEFETARQAYLDQLQRRLDLRTAPYLAENLPLYEQMAAAAPDSIEIVQRSQDKQREARAVYARLVSCAGEARDRQQWALARRCLHLAQRLNPKPALAQTLRQVEARLDEIQQQEADRMDAVTRQRLATAQAELAQDNVKEALMAYRQIPAQHRDRDEVVQFRQTLDVRIEQTIAEGIDIGRKFYTQGKVERALAIWHALEDLNPGHEALSAHITRGEKVLDKLNSLRSDEGVVPPGRGDSDS